MPVAHRHSDFRACGATTIVTGQSTVYVNSKLWAVEGDEDSHEEGPLLAVNGVTVFIEGKKVITVQDPGSAPDNAGHSTNQVRAISGSGDTAAYDTGPLVSAPPE